MPIRSPRWQMFLTEAPVATWHCRPRAGPGDPRGAAGLRQDSDGHRRRGRRRAQALTRALLIPLFLE
eukprot:12296868-Alexandrium_andersonii.AAC.1